MIAASPNSQQPTFFRTLKEQISHKHPLFILANKINWQVFEEKFSSLYCDNNGRPAKPIRLMTGLLILKHLRDVSDESVVEQWEENMFYQYFCGEVEYQAKQPCAASELVHFRNRIGEAGVELILQESIRVNGKDALEEQVSIDTTVQEKNITFPTDAKAHKKIVKKCWKIAEQEGTETRQSYKRTMKKLALDQRFRNNPKNKKKAAKADRKIKTIAGRLTRELERRLPPSSRWQKDLALFKKVLAQKKNDKDKIYSLHEPEVKCIGKGKEHKKYEFGNKVSIMYTQTTGVIVGALSFRNEYDGHTLDEALKQYERLLAKTAQSAIADRGYRGTTQVRDTRIEIPRPFSDKNMSKYEQRKKRKRFKRRAAIEPIIGHLKADCRLSRNFYAGIKGDAINAQLSAAAFNFKRMMNKWKKRGLLFLRYIRRGILRQLSPSFASVSLSAA